MTLIRSLMYVDYVFANCLPDSVDIRAKVFFKTIRSIGLMWAAVPFRLEMEKEQAKKVK